jgi:hypothetical protein
MRSAFSNSLCRDGFSCEQTICRLAFGTDFCWIANVPPTDDQVTSLPAIDGNTHCGTAFTTTHWSVVLEAQGATPAAQVALEKLCSTCWRPIYGFVRRYGSYAEEAKDLT